MKNKTTRGGKRKGAGRKPAIFPYFLKKLRASEAEHRRFMDILTGDARRDFLLIMRSLEFWCSSKESREKWD